MQLIKYINFSDDNVDVQQLVRRFFFSIEIPKAHASTHLHYFSGRGIWLCAATIKVGQFVSPSVIFPLIFSGPALDPITNPWVFFFVATTTFISHSILGSLLMRLTNIYLLHSYGRLKIIQALKLCKYLKFDSFSFSISFPFWCVFFSCVSISFPLLSGFPFAISNITFVSYCAYSNKNKWSERMFLVEFA